MLLTNITSLLKALGSCGSIPSNVHKKRREMAFSFTLDGFVWIARRMSFTAEVDTFVSRGVPLFRSNERNETAGGSKTIENKPHLSSTRIVLLFSKK